MTIQEVITRLDELKPHQYDLEIIVDWLSNLEGKIYNDFLTHNVPPENMPVYSGEPYTVNDLDTELLVQKPYDNLYITYIAAQIDFNNGEISRYNNSMTMVNKELLSFVDYYNRTNMPYQKNNVRI